jgi:hypothetical protein
MNLKKITLLLLATIILLTSCSDDNDANLQEPLGSYDNGLFVLHEGNFGQGNASVAFVSDDLTRTDYRIFNYVNALPLGDTAQSITFYKDLAYIILNNSNKIEIVNRYTFESVATIDAGLNNPRHMAVAGNKGFVTNWGDASVTTDDYIAIIDLGTNLIELQTIAVDEGPEEIVAQNNRLYVAHQGGFGQNNTLSIIDTDYLNVFHTLNVGDVPNSLQFDQNRDLWVLSGGKPSWTGDETPGKLSKINTTNLTIASYDFESTEHPNYLSTDGDNLYYFMAGDVFKMPLNATELPTTAQISGLTLYNMTVNNNTLYGVDAVDFTSNGKLHIYDLTDNSLIQEITVSIIPNNIYFN